MKKVIIIAIICLLAGGAGIWYVFNKPHEKVENIKGVTVSATELCREYSTNENAANAKYLNKAIEVSGTVTDTSTNQDGGLMIVLGDGDPTQSVECAMRDKGTKVVKGQKITIKGFCSGSMITGVSLTDCVLE